MLDKNNFEKPTTEEVSEDQEEFDAPTVEKNEEKEREPIKIEEDKVVVMGVEIPRNAEAGPRTPDLERFKDFIKDEFSLRLLQKIAKGVVLDQPTMLEGEAAVGKSYTIEYLAALTNNEVFRMSLNGQTDTTDLIGKWVPKDKTARERIEELFEHPERCDSPEARKLIESTKIKQVDQKEEEINPNDFKESPKLGLTKEEFKKIAQLEDIPTTDADWVWQDGEVPSQIKRGAWTVLDEVNTCEPQILVRLNSLLEEGGRIILQEDNDRIPECKDPNKKHKLFATVNPPGGKYRGRVPLSAEWISRWNYQNVGELPKETAIFREKKRLGCKVELNKETLKEDVISPIKTREEFKLTELLKEEWIEDFVEKYVTAIYKIQELLNEGKVARDQRQKFDFDQRDLHRFTDYVKTFFEPDNMKETIKDAIEYCLLSKFKNEKDIEKIKDIVFDLIQVDEPKIKNLKDKEVGEKVLNNVKAKIVGMGIPEGHKEELF